MKSISKALLFVLFILISTLGFAQNPLTESNLSAVKAEQITDQQLTEFVSKARSSGLSEDQIINLVASRGLPTSEMNILKDRIGKLQISSAPATAPLSAEVPNNPVLKSSSETTKSVQVKSESVPEQSSTRPIYGHSYFKNNSFQLFEKGSDVKAPDDYMINSGDEFAISVFGFSYFNEVQKVDAQGYIKPSNIGPIYIKGLTFGKAKELIRSKFSGFFDMSNNQLTVTLSYSRILTVNIVGEVDKPGSYKIPAINTAFNALIAVGGPNELGSVRNIQIKRNGKLIKTLDVYEFMSNPNSKLDYFLENNDFIVIPSSKRVVTIEGEVRRPMRYEILDKEGLSEVFMHAGGLTTKAYTGLISVNRLSEKGNERKIIDISLDSLVKNKKTFLLQDGDEVLVHAKQEALYNFLTINGAVNLPGRFELKAGDRISDLIRKANGLLPEANSEIAYLVRTKSDLTKEYISIDLAGILIAKPNPTQNLLLQKGDVVNILSRKSYMDSYKVSIAGEVRGPGSFDYSEKMTLSDLILMAGGLKDYANKEKAFLVRIKEDFNKEFISVDLKLELDSTVSKEKKMLIQKGDEVTILSEFDQVNDFSVNVVGLVKHPGSYNYSNKMTLSDVLYLAGGFKLEADPMRIEVTRTSFFSNEYKAGQASKVIVKSIQIANGKDLSAPELNFQLSPFDQVFVRMVPDFEYQKNITIQGEVVYPGTYALSSKEEHLADIIKRAGGLNGFAFPDGATLERQNLPGKYMVMNLRQAVKSRKSEYNYILQDGDIITVPKIIDLIAIRGGVQYLELVKGEQVNVPYMSGKRANYYIKEFSNGFGDNAWRRKTYVQDHNYKINRTHNFLFFKIYPKVRKGSVIYVVNKPPKEKKEKKDEKPVDWNKTISDITVKLTGLATLYILLRSAGLKI